MTNQYITAVLFIIFLISCSDKDSSEFSCVDSVIDSQKMEPYGNQEIQCEFYLILFEFQNSQYFTLNSHCADIGLQILDCKGNNLCEDDSEWCNNFFEDAEEIGIVGIEN